MNGPVYSWKLADAGPLSVASIAVATAKEKPRKAYWWGLALAWAACRRANQTQTNYFKPHRYALRGFDLHAEREPPVTTRESYRIRKLGAILFERDNPARGFAEPLIQLCLRPGERNYRRVARVEVGCKQVPRLQIKSPGDGFQLV